MTTLGVLSINSQGNLALHCCSNGSSPLWSTKESTTFPKNAAITAQLHNAGNFILQERPSNHSVAELSSPHRYLDAFHETRVPDFLAVQRWPRSRGFHSLGRPDRLPATIHPQERVTALERRAMDRSTLEWGALDDQKLHLRPKLCERPGRGLSLIQDK